MTDHVRRICIQCKHYGDEDRKAVRDDVQCKASPYPTGIDPVSGLTLPYGADGVPGSGHTHRRCRDVNDGTCQQFEAIETSTKPETQGDLFAVAKAAGGET